MKKIYTNSTDLTGYKLTISRRSMFNTNFKNYLIDKTPQFNADIDSSKLNQDEFEQIDLWIRNFWKLQDGSGPTNLKRYEDDLKREIHSATEKIFLRWDSIFKKELKRKLKN